MQINKDRNWKNSRRASLRLYIHHHLQLSHVTPRYALPLAVCILMLPMLVVVNEHMQLATMNSMTFSHTPLVLSSLNNVIPTMILQNRVEQSNIGHLSCSPSRCNIQHTSSSIGLKVCSRRKVMIVVMLLLLLLSGDIETNPGPLGQEDLRVLHCELHPVSDKWYSLGVQLQVPIETLKCVRRENLPMTERLLEMLTVWLKCTNPPPTWDILTEALESPPVGEGLLAQQLRDKYCPRTEGGTTDGSPTLGRTFRPSAPQVQLGEHGYLLSSHTPLYQFTQPAVPFVEPQASASSYSTVTTHLTPPEITTFPHPHIIAHTGGLLSTTSCPHGGGRSVESRDNSGEEERIEEENCMSFVSDSESLSVYPESVILPTHQKYESQHHPPQHQEQHQGQHRHHSSFQSPSQPLYNISIHSSQACHQPSNQPQAQSYTYHHPPFQPPLEQPRCQRTQYSHYQPSHHSPNPPPHQHSNPPIYTSETPYQQSHYQPHYQIPPQSVHMYQPPYQHSYPSMGRRTYQHPGYHQTSAFQSFQFPPFQHHKTPFHPFCQTHYQDPVQPIYPYKPLHQPTRLCTPQPLPLSHPDSPLEEYARFLRAYYTQHHAPCTKWPQLDTRKYINLAVVDNKYAKRADLVKFRKQTIHGSIDDILEWKAPIEMKNILEPNCVYDTFIEKHEYYPVTQLLIEGAPGIGKSTFAWEVCQKWGQHHLFNEYSLVVLLKFRDKRMQEAKGVTDLFYHPHPKLQSEIVDCIVLSGGHGLLLILEGFDEAPASKRTMDSIYVQLFIGLVLPKATVILTTRPSASAELRELCKGKNCRRIEILGFGKKEIDDYIQCAFSDEQSRSDFNQYLSLYPHIHSMMYVPLNSAIVTHVYESCKSSGAVVPKTMTQLYSSLIKALLLRYLKDKEEYKDTCTKINSLRDLPQPVYDQFCEICKIAYLGILSAELIFQDLPSYFDTLGLMQTCPELYVDRGASVSHNFLHLTVQEYLAAYHISQQSRDEQVEFMRKSIESKNEMMVTIEDFTEYEEMGEADIVRDYFECKNSPPHMKVEFRDGSKKLEMVVRFQAGLTELERNWWYSVGRFASMAQPDSSFLQEETKFIKLEILHWLFESQNLSAITGILGSDCVCFYNDCSNALPFDWHVLGYCITHSTCSWKLELHNYELESAEIFLKALNLQQDQCSLASTGQIKGVWLKMSNPDVVRLLAENMSQMLVFRNLTHLSLVNCNLTSKTCDLLSEYTDLLQHFEYLNLSESPIGGGGAMNLITSLTRFSIIKELHLGATGIGFEDCKALNELLASSKYLEVLDVSDNNLWGCHYNNLSPDSIQLIVDGLSHNTSLEKLNMRYSNFSSENVFHLASVLRVNAGLKELDIQHCNIQSSDSVHLAKALEENPSTQLQTLWLWGNRIGSEGAVAFASMLKRNQCLKMLDLEDASIGVEGALKLIESLKHNKTLKKLELSYKCKPSIYEALQCRVMFN